MFKKCIFYIVIILSFSNSYSQIVFYQDNFIGGVTGAGYSPEVGLGGTGSFTVYIAPGSTIRKAWLMAGRVGNAAAVKVTLNGMSYLFNSTNQVTPTFQSNYGGPSAVHAIDVTSSINAANVNYTIEVPPQSNNGSSDDRFNDFYLYIAYANASLSEVNTVIYLNSGNFAASQYYSLSVNNSIKNTSDVGVSLFTGYVCNITDDGENVFINSTNIGLIGGNDINSGFCGGPIGSFYYQNNTLTGLSDDNADMAVSGSDALSNAKTLIINESTAINMQFTHQVGANNNSIWGVILTYGGKCGAGTGKDTTVQILQGEAVNHTATGGISYVWSPAVSLTCISCQSPVATPGTTTIYTVEVTKPDGCKNS